MKFLSLTSRYASSTLKGMYTLFRRSFLFVAVASVWAVFYVQNIPVSAAEKMSQRLVCLNPVRCDVAGASCQEKTPHRVRLTSEKKNSTIPNEKTYIIECVSTAQGQLCTTGNADTLPELGWDINLENLKKTVGYEFQGLFQTDGKAIFQLQNPIVSNGQGMIDPIEWQSATNDSVYHTFYALNFYSSSDLKPEDSTSQKQGTFNLIPDTGDCTSLRWDPYGVVFDSQTLEPIPGVKVTLFEKKDTSFAVANIPGVSSIVNTKEDGAFNFVVPDGTYKLDASHPGYLSLPTDLTIININYSRMYSDLYPPSNTSNEITQTGGKTQHRDIPLNPQPNTKGIYPIKVINYYETLSKISNSLVIRGKVSHPFTKIKVYTTTGAGTEKSRYLSNQATADKMGAFTVQINLSILQPGERIGGLEFEKVNFANPISMNYFRKIFSAVFNNFIPQVSAQDKLVQTSVDLPLEPIVNALDGFAYDNTGKVIPNATVGVYLTFAKQPYYETKADEKGYFKITSEFLPSMPFTLQYQNSAGLITKTTITTFMSQNSQYIEASSINPYIYKDAKGKAPTVTATSAPVKQVDNPLIVPQKTNRELAFMITVVIILLFGLVGTVVGVYLINKKNKTA